LRTEIRQRLHRSRDWPSAIDELEREAEDVKNERERSELLFEIGNLTEEVIPERDRALALYQRAWKLFPENIKALTRARQIYREIGRLEMVAKVGELELKVRERDRSAVAELAGLVGEALLDCRQRDKALPLLQLALEQNPDALRVKDALAAAEYDPEDWIDAVERLSTDAQRFDPTTAARMLLRAARIVHLETPDDALYEKLLKQVLVHDPQNESANFLYESLLSRTERWEELEMHHLGRAIAVVEDSARAGLYRQFALEWVQRFKDRERGARFFAKAIEMSARNGTVHMPSMVAGFTLVREAYGARADWQPILTLADVALARALPDEQRLFVAVQAGLVAWRELKDVDRARAYFRVAMSVEPGSPHLADFESEVGPDRAAQPTPMASRAHAPTQPPAPVPSATPATGVVASGGLAAGSMPRMPAVPPPVESLSGDAESAVEAARAAEAEGPERAIQAWRQVVQQHPSLRTPRRELARVLRESEKWGPLVEALKDEEHRLSATPGVNQDEQVAVLHELADAYGNLRNDLTAVNTLNQILKIDPGNVDALDRLIALYERMKRWPDLVAALGKRAPLIDDPGQRVALYLRIAGLYIEKFSNQAEAIKAFEKVLEIEPDNRPAIHHLMEVYEKRRDWEKLISLRERDIDRTADPAERAARTYEVAQLAATRVKKPDVCIHWWAKVLATDPRNEEAVGELEKLYERAKEWGRLAEVLALKADLATDPRRQSEALQKLGLLYTDKVDDRARAIDAWRRLLAIEPENRRAQDSLKKLYITARSWDELESFYRAQGKLDEYVRVIERQVEMPGDEGGEYGDADKMELATKIALLYRDTLEKPDRAMRAFEKVLSLDESNLAAAEALIPLYEQARDPRKLVKVLEIQLDQTREPELRQERLERLAHYSEERLRDKHAAYGWWLRAHTENRDAAWIREHAERLAQETGGWRELVDAYEASARASSDRAKALPLIKVVARVQERELREIDRALETSRAVLDIDPSDQEALEALERLHAAKGDHRELLGIHRRKLELTRDPRERSDIQFKIGQLYEDVIGDDDQAIATYAQVLETDGEDLRALRALDRILERNQRWPELAEILVRELALVDPSQSSGTGPSWVELKYRLGRIREGEVGDVAGAIENYREILAMEPGHDRARAALERRLDDGQFRLAAAGILEPIYEQLDQADRMIRVHEIQLESSAEPMRRVGLLMRIGELYSKRLGDAEKAFSAFARAFSEDPHSAGAKSELEELCNLLDDGWPRMIQLFEGALGAADLEPHLAHELSIKVARAYESLGNSDKAIEYYRRALHIEPEDLEVIDALERIFHRDERYLELLDVYRRKVDISSDPDERMQILFRIASIHEELLHSADDAISTYNEILSHAAENPRALRALDRLYVQGGQWQDLGDNLVRQLSLAERGDERVALLTRLAELRETQLGETAAAIETYRQVLELDPHSDAAQAALERLINQPEHELAIAQVLEPIYRATANWSRQIAVYEIMARHALDPQRKIELFHAVAELYELGGDDLQASFATYARAFREEPRSEATQAQLERLARVLSGWHELVQLYDAVIHEIGDEELRVHLLTRLAQLYEQELGDDRAAVATYEAILRAAPGNIDAASAIQTIHERDSDYPALVAALVRKSEILVDLEERKMLLYKAAQIQEEVLDNADEAIATYRAILDLDDLDLTAMNSLERLYIRLERWEPLKDIYGKKAELAEDPDAKKQMLYVLGQVHDRELRDVGKAIETYQAILDLDADELPAIQALDRLYGQAERWYDLLQILERQVELAETTGEAVALKYRIGQLWHHRLADLARAVESYKEALALDYGHNETLVALDGLLRSDEGEPAVMAARVLEPIYQAAAEYDRLIDVLEVMIRYGDNPGAVVDLLHRVADLYEHRIERPRDALGAYARALREDSGNELTLGHLERLADLTRSWRELVQLYAGEAEKSLDVPRQVDLLSRLARVYEEELTLSEEAIGIYRRILEAEFDNRAAVLALDRLYSGAGRWKELADILRKEIQLADSDRETLALQFRLGQTLEQYLRDLPAAIEVYREILAADSNHTSAMAALEMLFLEGHHEVEIASVLEPLYLAAGEFEKLHKIYEVELGKLTDPVDRAAMFQRLAELAEDRLLDGGRAFTWWGQALAEDAGSAVAVEHVERLARETSGWIELVSVYIRVLERHHAADVQRQMLLRLARVYDAELRDAASAVDSYLRVLEIDEKDSDALAALDRLYATAGMYDELVEILRRRIEVTLDGDEIVAMQLRRGEIFAEALADLDSALACYEQILEQDTRNRAALEREEAIFFRREDWQRLQAVYEKLVDVAEGEAEMADLYARMARIASDALDDEERAIDMWGRVLDIRAEDPQALSALADLYGRRELWNELVEIIDRQVAVARDDRERVLLHKRLGRVWADKLGRERNALDAWLAAQELDPGDLETLRALAQLYRSTQAWEELSQTLRRIIGVGQTSGDLSENDLIELFAQLGQLEGDLLGRVNEAVDAWRKVLVLDPTDVRALNALEQLFIREARWEECIEVLESRAAAQEEPSGRIDTLLQAAAIWEEKVDDKERAAELYERVRALDAGNRLASERLEEIYRTQYRWEQLNEILLERVEFTEQQTERIRLLQTVARIYEEELGGQESAFDVLQVAFRYDYSDEDTARELERLATAAGKWQELLAEYTQMVQGLERDDRERACDLWVKIGRWYGDHLAHIDYAIHSVQQALRLNPNHLGALSALAAFQRKRGSWHELIETLGRHAAVEPDRGKKVDLYLNLAELLETQMQDAMQAIAAYQAALQADPSAMEALVALDRLYRRHEMWEPLIDVLGRMAELRVDPDEVVQIRLEIGELWDMRLLDAAQAIQAYQDVRNVDPSNLSALRALEQLYEKTGDSERYLDILEAQLDASPSDAEQIALYERMSSAWEERFGKLDRAADCLEKIVAIDEGNQVAYRELERLYRQQGRWDSLVDTYRRHIAEMGDAVSRIELYCWMGQVYEEELRDHDRAIEAYVDVLTMDADEPRALDALGRLYEQIQEWHRAIDVMAQLTRIVQDPVVQVDLHYRSGRIYYTHLASEEEAEQHFRTALTIDAAHVPTMEELTRLYANRGDWLKAAQMMVQAESYTANVLDKIRLLYDAARIYLDHLKQRDRAKDLLAAVMALDPEHVDAAAPLADICFEARAWPELSPILDVLVRKAPQRGLDSRELNELYYRTARTADELGDHARALQFYKAAYDIDSTYLPVLVGRADLLFNMQDWEGAGKIYQTILVQHRDSQAEADVVRTYYRLGMVRQNLGERRKALNMFEKALEIDPGHADTLLAVIAIQEQQGDWEAVIHAKRGLMARADGGERVKLLDEIGGIYHKQLNNPQKASAAFLEALEVRQDDHQLLQKVLDLYTETEQWKKAVETILRFVELEKDPIRKGSYYQAAGTICRDKLKALDEAIDYYNVALDNFFVEGSEKIPKSFLPRALKAFADIDKILTTKRDWKAQERAYRAMIKRLKPGDKVLIDLWHALGEIYRSRLKHYQSAVEAFEVAQQLDPSNKDRREILAELYILSGPEHTDKAVEQHMEMLKLEPFKYDSYKALRRIYMDSHQYDKTWCICNALAFLRKADPEELQFYEQYKPRGFVKAKSRMTEEIWRHVHHPDENAYVGAIFAAIWQGAAMIRAQPHKAFGLKPKDRRAIETDQLQFSKIFYYTAQVLNVPLPHVYLQPEQPGEIAVANTQDKGQLVPSFVVRSSLLQGRAEREIAFSCARWLSFMRPDHFLKLALPTNTELKTAFLSAVALVRPDFPIPSDMRALVAQYLPEMQKRIQPHWLEQLGIVVNRFLQAAPEINLARWGNAVEATAHRVGFIIGGDLEVAARMVSVEPVVVGGPQVKDKVKELVVYSISEDYFKVRHHLGTTIG
jgi:golgin subfamily B member 1